jgi:hypothetical protein
MGNPRGTSMLAWSVVLADHHHRPIGTPCSQQRDHPRQLRIPLHVIDIRITAVPETISPVRRRKRQARLVCGESNSGAVDGQGGTAGRVVLVKQEL